MSYIRSLPPVRYIVRLAHETYFPASCTELMEIAIEKKYPKSMVKFLEQFPADEIFDSRSDFENRCEELELFIKEERDMPKERLKSPQE